MQIDTLPETLDRALHGGLLMVIVTLAAYAIRIARKAIKRMDRDETLRADYPPHRHINGSIVYPSEYEPAHVDRLNLQENQS